MTVFEYMMFEVGFSVELEIVKFAVKQVKENDNFSILNVGVVKDCGLRVYKLHPKIEILEEKEKRELWETTKSLFPGK